MRYISYVFYGSLMIVLVLIAIANRSTTELNLVPDELEFFGFNFSISLPVYVIFFGGIIFGVIIGFVWEWLREHKHRAEVARKRGELRRAEQQLRKIKGEKYKAQDDVLALLDETT